MREFGNWEITYDIKKAGHSIRATQMRGNTKVLERQRTEVYIDDNINSVKHLVREQTRYATPSGKRFQISKVVKCRLWRGGVLYSLEHGGCKNVTYYDRSEYKYVPGCLVRASGGDAKIAQYLELPGAGLNMAKWFKKDIELGLCSGLWERWLNDKQYRDDMSFICMRGWPPTSAAHFIRKELMAAYLPPGSWNTIEAATACTRDIRMAQMLTCNPKLPLRKKYVEAYRAAEDKAAWARSHYAKVEDK